MWNTSIRIKRTSQEYQHMGNLTQATGGCLCGRVRFECSGEVVHSLVCHCRMCQRASGSSFAGIMFVPSRGLIITAGETRIYGSSTTSKRHFCADCGSSLFFERVSSSLHGILVGALDDPNVFEPTMHICLSSKQAWVALSDGLPGHQQKPTGMTPTGSYDSISGGLVEGTG